MIHPYLNVNGDSIKELLNLYHGWIIAADPFNQDVITYYTCTKLTALIHVTSKRGPMCRNMDK